MASSDEPFSCSICLERFRDPVTVPCGHSFCMSCLRDYWDRRRKARCPQCRAAFRPRPRLGRNVVLQDMMRNMEAASLNGGAPSAPPAHEVLGVEHAAAAAAAAYPEHPATSAGQNLVKETRRRVTEHIEEKSREIDLLKKLIQSFYVQASTAARDSDGIFAELLDFLQQRRFEVKELIVAQQEAEVTQARSLLQLLTKHMVAVKRMESELMELSHVPDVELVTELQMCESVLNSPMGSWTFCPDVSFGPVRKAVADVKEQIQSLYHHAFPSVASAVKDVKLRAMEKTPEEVCDPASIPTPDSRDDLMQYFSEPSFDPFTAHREISLAERNRAARRSGKVRDYPDHPDRFDSWCQALCSEALRGRRYYEVEWDGTVSLGLAYECIGRKGSSDGCRLGHSDTSWTLQCSAAGLTFLHGRREVPVSAGDARHRRIGVFLDHGAGLLCFYAVTRSKLRLLLREETRFRGPLLPAVWLGSRSAVSFCAVDSL